MTELAKLEHRRGVRNKLDPNYMVSRQFAPLLCAYLECSNEVQKIIQDMAIIVDDPEATNEEREAAAATIAEALFPCGTNGAMGTDLEDAEVNAAKGGGKEAVQEMNQEEEHFAGRVNALMKEQGLTQADL